MPMKRTAVNKICSFVFLWLSLQGLLSSCHKTANLSPDQYMAYVDDKDNGLAVSRTLNNIVFSAKYEPVAYKAIRELKDLDSSLTQKNYQAMEANFKDYCYFIFRIGSSSGSKNPFKALARTQEDYAKIFRYTQTAMQRDFYLESDGKTLPCVMYHMEGDHNMLNYSLISLGFESKNIDPAKDLTLVYNDQVFECGPVKFTITQQAQTNLPHIKFL